MAKNIIHSKKPKTRSKLRTFLGKKYYTLIRYIKWHADRKIEYAVLTNNGKLPCVIAEHQSHLYRKLKDVDMWLQDNKVVNLKIAAKKINSLILKSGETFSYYHP